MHPQTKHLSLPDIILIVEGVNVAVSWCAALSFSTSLMTSVKIWGSFSYILAVMVVASTALNKDADCHSVIVKSTLLSCCLQVMDIGSKSFIVLLLYLHKV